MKQNIGTRERVVRVVLGAGIVSLAFVGPASPWAWLGLAPLLTGLTGWCLTYTLLGIDRRGGSGKEMVGRRSETP